MDRMGMKEAGKKRERADSGAEKLKGRENQQGKKRRGVRISLTPLHPPANLPLLNGKTGKGELNLYILILPGGQGAGLKVLLQKLHHLFFSLGDLKVRILAEAVKEDDGVQNFPANDAVQSVENIVHVVKFLKNHPAAATLAANPIGPFLVSFLHGVYCWHDIPQRTSLLLSNLPNPFSGSARER